MSRLSELTPKPGVITLEEFIKLKRDFDKLRKTRSVMIPAEVYKELKRMGGLPDEQTK